MDAGMPFSRPISDRYFEDYVEGDVHRFGTIAVEADEIVAFAKRFDPQTLHTDPEAAKWRRITLGQAGAPRRHSVSARDRAQSRPLEIKARSRRDYFVRRGNQSG